MDEERIAADVVRQLVGIQVGDVITFDLASIGGVEYEVTGDRGQAYALRIVKHPTFPSAVGVDTGVNKDWLDSRRNLWRRVR